MATTFLVGMFFASHIHVVAVTGKPRQILEREALKRCKFVENSEINNTGEFSNATSRVVTSYPWYSYLVSPVEE